MGAREGAARGEGAQVLRVDGGARALAVAGGEARAAAKMREEGEAAAAEAAEEGGAVVGDSRVGNRQNDQE